jgi:hypothetical protein
MKIDSNRLQLLVKMIAEEKLMSAEEVERALCLAKHDFPFRAQVQLADSLHYHIHVEDVAVLPHEKLIAAGGKVVNEAEGYIKYAFDGGVNFIFSHIPVAQKERQVSSRLSCWLDHMGIDIRSDDKPAYITFQQIPLICSQEDYLFTRQGDGKNAVKCCHMQVKEKYWVYPDGATNYEFAFGPLVIHEGGFGIDLRPANPFIIAEENTSCCGSTKEIKQKPAIFIN